LIKCCEILGTCDEFLELCYLIFAENFFISENEDIDKLKEEFNKIEIKDKKETLDYNLNKEKEMLKRFPFLNN
jgi:hypothetical protein